MRKIEGVRGGCAVDFLVDDRVLRGRFLIRLRRLSRSGATEVGGTRARFDEIGAELCEKRDALPPPEKNLTRDPIARICATLR